MLSVSVLLPAIHPLYNSMGSSTVTARLFATDPRSTNPGVGLAVQGKSIEQLLYDYTFMLCYYYTITP